MSRSMSILFCSFLSMIPVAELRGAIPFGLSAGIHPVFLYFLCVLSNLVPVPFILLFLRRILLWMRTRGGWLRRIADWLLARADRKSETVRKYELFGLFLLVAIPLPGTGAWTGALVAGLLNLRMKKAFPAIAAGVAAAGIVTMLICLGVVRFIL